jgi:cytochrome o ubiquinol oxidase subunit 3
MTQAMTAHHHHQHDADTRDLFGFWLYILSDCILFSSLFACYAVLYKNIYGGLSVRDFTDLPFVFYETMALLASSFTYGLAMISSQQNKVRQVIFWLMVTFLCGLVFINLEVKEFIHLYESGHSWQSSSALSAFFTLVGTHGLHVTVGLLWMLVLMCQLMRFGMTGMMKRRLTYLGIFWAFLDIIWIFVFTIVYLMGVI